MIVFKSVGPPFENAFNRWRDCDGNDGEDDDEEDSNKDGDIDDD